MDFYIPHLTCCRYCFLSEWKKRCNYLYWNEHYSLSSAGNEQQIISLFSVDIQSYCGLLHHDVDKSNHYNTNLSWDGVVD